MCLSGSCIILVHVKGPVTQNRDIVKLGLSRFSLADLEEYGGEGSEARAKWIHLGTLEC